MFICMNRGWYKLIITTSSFLYWPNIPRKRMPSTLGQVDLVSGSAMETCDHDDGPGSLIAIYESIAVLKFQI